MSAAREPRHAHVHGHFAVADDLRHDDPARRLDADPRRLRVPVVAHELDEAARAVAALLDLAAVGVEDPVAEVDVGARRPLDDEDLIAADAEPPVGEPPVLRRGEVDVLPMPSSTTKSLPSPCILVKRSFVGPHGGSG